MWRLPHQYRRLIPPPHLQLHRQVGLSSTAILVLQHLQLHLRMSQVLRNLQHSWRAATCFSAGAISSQHDCFTNALPMAATGTLRSG